MTYEAKKEVTASRGVYGQKVDEMKAALRSPTATRGLCGLIKACPAWPRQTCRPLL